MTLKLLLPGCFRVGVRRGLLLELPPSGAVSGGDGLGVAASEKRGELIPGDAVQPTSKGPLSGVIVPTARRLGDGQEDLLRQSCGVRFLQAALVDEPYTRLP